MLCDKCFLSRAISVDPSVNLLKILNAFILSYVYGNLSACVSGPHLCVWCTVRSEEVLDLLELENLVVVSSHVGAGH